MGTIAGYEILAELGRGGAGVVYRVREPGTGRELALKLVPRGAEARALRRFEREAQALARVRHPHVIAVHAAGVEPSGQAFLPMELVEGQDLAAHVARQGPVPPRQAAEWVAQAAAGIEAAHAVGIVHRDLKPENLLLGADGRVRVSDFGLVRDLDRSDVSRLSQTGHFLGTPTYWPPEQARGDHAAVDARSDVYGLGGSLCFLLTGRPPQGGETLSAALDQLAQPPRPPLSLGPGVPPALDAIVLRCLARSPEQRYPSAAALGEDLRRFLAGERVAPLRRRGLLVAGLAGAVALGLAAAVWGARADRGTPSPAASREDPATPASPAPESPAPAVDPHTRLVEAAGALNASPGRDAYEQLVEALAVVYDAGRPQPSVSRAAQRLNAEADPYQDAGARLLAACTYREPSGRDAQGRPYAFVDDDAWTTLVDDPFDGHAAPRVRPEHEALAKAKLQHLVDQLARARPKLEGRPQWRLVVRRIQQVTAEALLATIADQRETGEEVEALLALAPASITAQRLQMVAYFRGLIWLEALPPAWETLDAEPCFRLLQAGLNMAHERVEPARVLECSRELRALNVKAGGRHRHAERAFLLLTRWLPGCAYQFAVRAGGPLPREQVDVLRSIVVPPNEVPHTTAEAFCLIGLALLGPSPERAWDDLKGAPWLRTEEELRYLQTEAEIHAAYGDLDAARTALLSFPEGMPLPGGLVQRLGLDVGERRLFSQHEHDFPWHSLGPGRVPAGAWWPGQR